MQIRAQRTTRTGNGQMRAVRRSLGEAETSEDAVHGGSSGAWERDGGVHVWPEFQSACMPCHGPPSGDWSPSVLHPQSTVASAVRDQRRDLLLLPRVRVLFYLKVKHWNTSRMVHA